MLSGTDTGCGCGPFRRLCYMLWVRWPGIVKWGYGWLTECTMIAVHGCIDVVWHELNGWSILASCVNGASGACVLWMCLTQQISVTLDSNSGSMCYSSGWWMHDHYTAHEITPIEVNNHILFITSEHLFNPTFAGGKPTLHELEVASRKITSTCKVQKCMQPKLYPLAQQIKV